MKTENCEGGDPLTCILVLQLGKGSALVSISKINMCHNVHTESYLL